MSKGRLTAALAISALISLSGCTATGGAMSETDTGVAVSKDGQELLLEDGQEVILTFTEGPASKEMGSQGMGSFLHPYRAESGTFGPTRVLAHDVTSLTFRGRRDTCIMTADRKVSCEELGSGHWEFR